MSKTSVPRAPEKSRFAHFDGLQFQAPGPEASASWARAFTRLGVKVSTEPVRRG
jgi:hypothetical protein